MALRGDLAARSRSGGARDVVRAAAEEIVGRAVRHLGAPCATSILEGDAARAVVEAARNAELLVLARSADQSVPGPHSLDRATRFVVDHAPCTVILVWPQTPRIAPLPPPPSGSR